MNNMVRSAIPPIHMLIVDDEPVICQGLRYTIPWEELGIHVVGEAYDGVQALEMVKQHNVEVLLTDICMDGMDGLQLTEQLKAHFPHVRVIMISGHEDFEYARQAVRLDVKDYLLKPVEIDELIQVVSTIVQEIHKTSEEQGQQVSQEAWMWLSRMIHHPVGQRAEIGYFPAVLQGEQYIILCTQLSEYQEHYHALAEEDYRCIQSAWEQHIHQSLSEYGYRYISSREHCNLLITFISSDQIYSDMQWQEQIALITQHWSGISSLYSGVSSSYECIAETASAIQQSLQALVPYPSATPIREHRNINEDVQQLVASLLQQDHQQLMNQITLIFDDFRKRQYSLSDIVLFHEELNILLRQRLHNSGMTAIDYQPLFTGEIDLYQYNSYHSLQLLWEQQFNQLLPMIEQQGLDRSYWSIEKAKKWIQERYHTDIKASEVAAWLKITPGYFSYIFKQSTGQSFTEYMNKLRIEQAKHLLATTHDKVFEIADQVGYREYKYFVAVFKNVTGMTPKEYRIVSIQQKA